MGCGERGGRTHALDEDAAVVETGAFHDGAAAERQSWRGESRCEDGDEDR